MMAAQQETIAIDARALDGAAAYKLISGAITPRPIAWVCSLNDDGSVNLAPFSSFVFLTYDPPKIGLSIGPGTIRLKDTLRNIVARQQFVVNAVTAVSWCNGHQHKAGAKSRPAHLAMRCQPSVDWCGYWQRADR